MGIEAVIFDLDDTLVAESAAARQAVIPWAAEMGLDEPADVVFARWRAVSTKHYSRYQARQISFHEQRRSRVREFLPHVDLHDDQAADQAFLSYLRRYEGAWSCFHDVIPCLRALREAGITVGVLTNGDEAQQRTKLDIVGLSGELDFFIASSSLPAGKPDARAFWAACRAAEKAPSTCLMVGNDLRGDVHGAVAAGLHGLLLERERDQGSAAGASIPGLDHLRPSTMDLFVGGSETPTSTTEDATSQT